MHMYHSSSYYSILGVVPTATAKEIRTKYMQLARALHPDKNSYGTVTARSEYTHLT